MAKSTCYKQKKTDIKNDLKTSGYYIYIMYIKKKMHTEITEVNLGMLHQY